MVRCLSDTLGVNHANEIARAARRSKESCSYATGERGTEAKLCLREYED